jgi:hypothetical protein
MNFDTLFRNTKSDLPRSGCSSYYCTTCGGQFAKVRDSLHNIDKSELHSYLISLRFGDFANYGYMDNRREYVKHLLIQSNQFSQSEQIGIIDKWSEDISKSKLIDFYDFVVFYFLRYRPQEDELQKHYVDICLELIERSLNNDSLIETLVLVLKDRCPQHILELAINNSYYDEQMERVLINVFGHKFLRSKRATLTEIDGLTG